MVQTLIAERRQIHLGLTAVGRLLARLESTPQQPLRRAYERDPKRVPEWWGDRYPKLKQRAAPRGAKLFFLAEAGLQSDPILGRT